MVKRIIFKNKLGQLKIQQMIFMILAVGLLFIIIGLIFLSMTFRSLKNTAVIIGEKDSMLLVSKLANSPEFSCGDSFGTSKGNCVDFYKLMALKENIEIYSDFWGMSRIELKKIYPKNEVECNNDNYPECGIIKILDKKVNTLTASSVFVTLCRKESNEYKTYNKCELAKLSVASEDKNEK